MIASTGGIGARTGLRMMPTFPRSALSFRTAGFPQYGWKAGACSRNALTDDGLSSPFVHRVVTTVVPLCVGPRT